jgi:hypothetical protein
MILVERKIHGSVDYENLRWNFVLEGEDDITDLWPESLIGTDAILDDVDWFDMLAEVHSDAIVALIYDEVSGERR